jgi:hypothetical protein
MITFEFFFLNWLFKILLKFRAFNWIERVEKSVTCLLLDLSTLLRLIIRNIGPVLLCLIPG